jgi:hypothetical protein
MFRLVMCLAEWSLEMNGFDRFCAVLAGLLAAVLMGVMGLFAGIKAHFSLPPVLGAAPALAGWGIIRSIMLAWNVDSKGSQPTLPPSSPSGSPPVFSDWASGDDNDRDS